MSPGVPTKVIAANVGLTAFAVALVAGLAADNPLEQIVIRALIAMLICHVVGYAIGSVMERALRDSLLTYKESALAAQRAALQAARAARQGASGETGERGSAGGTTVSGVSPVSEAGVT